MENALLIGLSRQMVLRRHMDIIANNMANTNTAGYKRDSLMFEEHLMPVARMSDATGKDARLSFVQDPASFRNFQEGAFEQTGNELDAAISGDAWFVVQTDGGDRYTRNGQFQLNADGELVTATGDRVLGEGGVITLSPDESSIEIARDGTISTNQGQRGKLRLVSFEDNNALKKEGAMMFSTEAAPQEAEDARVIHGVVEKSNVQPILEMTRMMETMRTYQSVTRAMEQTNRLRQEAIQQLGGANAN